MSPQKILISLLGQSLLKGHGVPTEFPKVPQGLTDQLLLVSIHSPLPKEYLHFLSICNLTLYSSVKICMNCLLLCYRLTPNLTAWEQQALMLLIARFLMLPSLE